MPLSRDDKKGMTLIELLIAIAIAAVISETIVLVMESGMLAWRFGDAEISIQKVVQEVTSTVIEGEFETHGLRSALELCEGSRQGLTFVCMWEDTADIKFDMDKNAKFALAKQFKAGSNAPIVRIKEPGGEGYRTVTANFEYGSGRNPSKPDDYIIFKEALRKGTKVKFLYHPDPEYDESVLISYSWDPERAKLFKTYLGFAEEMPTYRLGAEVVGLGFDYYTSANEPIKLEKKKSLTEGQLKSVTAVGIVVDAKKGDELRTVRSFVSMRNIAHRGAGMVIAEGSSIPIPNSADIRALSLINMHGVEDGDKVELEITAPGQRSWKIKVNLGIPPESPKDTPPMILDYEVQYPSGSPVHSGGDRISVEAGVNLVGLGNDYYDYDDDENVNDKTIFTGDEVRVNVTRMDAEGAALSIQP